MADHSTIEWTDATWNPITGCAVVSPGCTNCYAMKLAGTRLKHHPSRQGLTRDTKAGPVWNGEVRLKEDWLAQPLQWKRPRHIFVCAHGDLFAEQVPDAWIMRVLFVMGQAPQHIFQVLTKRPERMRAFFRKWADMKPASIDDLCTAQKPDEVRKLYDCGRGHLFADMLESMGTPPPGCAYPLFDWMGGMANWPDALPNVWLGVSVEDQTRADERIPFLLDTPAAVRWISAEPLLEHVDLLALRKNGEVHTDALTRYYNLAGQRVNATIDWVVAGGESGPDARPMHPDWPLSLRDQCAASDTPLFFKQWGNWMPPPWKLAREEGESDTAYKSRSDAIAATHAIHTFHGHPVELAHRPWSVERAPEPPEAFAGIRASHKASAGRMLDGALHDAMPRRRAAP